MRSRIFNASRCAVLLATLLLAACAGAPELKLEQQEPGMSAIGIDVTLAYGKVPLGFAVERVYFLTEPSAAYFGKSVYHSNYSKDGRVYLLNVPPGSYIAVAATYYASLPLTESETTLFPEALAERTRITVRENEFAFMGSYMVEQSNFLFHSKDGMQIKVFNILQDEWKEDMTAGVGPISRHYAVGSLLETKSDSVATEEFLLKAKSDLAGSSWVDRLH
jgi:hypothetical protein